MAKMRTSRSHIEALGFVDKMKSIYELRKIHVLNITRTSNILYFMIMLCNFLMIREIARDMRLQSSVVMIMNCKRVTLSHMLWSSLDLHGTFGVWG